MFSNLIFFLADIIFSALISVSFTLTLALLSNAESISNGLQDFYSNFFHFMEWQAIIAIHNRVRFHPIHIHLDCFNPAIRHRSQIAGTDAPLHRVVVRCRETPHSGHRHCDGSFGDDRRTNLDGSPICRLAPSPSSGFQTGT